MTFTNDKTYPTHQASNGLCFFAEETAYIIPITRQEAHALRLYDKQVGGSLNWRLAAGSEIWRYVGFVEWTDCGGIYFNLDLARDTPAEREKIATIIREQIDRCLAKEKEST